MGCQGFTEPNLSTLLNKIKHPFEKKEYLINTGKSKKTFLKPQNYHCCLSIFSFRLYILNQNTCRVFVFDNNFKRGNFLAIKFSLLSEFLFTE